MTYLSKKYFSMFKYLKINTKTHQKCWSAFLVPPNLKECLFHSFNCDRQRYWKKAPNGWQKTASNFAQTKSPKGRWKLGLSAMCHFRPKPEMEAQFLLYCTWTNKQKIIITHSFTQWRKQVVGHFKFKHFYCLSTYTLDIYWNNIHIYCYNAQWS